MTTLVHFLIVHGPLLLLGVSLLLGAGVAGVALQRSPIHQQRLSELAMVCTLAWMILACVPMRRLSLGASQTGKAPEPTPADPRRVEISQVSHADQYSHDIALPYQASGNTLLSPLSESAEHAMMSPHLPPGKPQLHGSDRRTFWSAAAAVVYLAGSFLCVLYLALGHVLLARLIRRCRAPEPAIAGQFQAIARQYGARKARLLVCPGARPMSCGLWRPTVIIDQHLERSASDRLRQVLRHELAHLSQRDAWGNALFNLALPMLWAHPLYWWLRSRAFLARELVADERAAGFTARQTYAADLLSLARDCRSARPGPLAVVGMFHFTTDLKWRIHMLLQNSTPMPVRCSRRWRAASVCITAATLLTTGATLGLRPTLANGQTASTSSGRAPSTSPGQAPSASSVQAPSASSVQAVTTDQKATGADPNVPGNSSVEQAQTTSGNPPGTQDRPVGASAEVAQAGPTEGGKAQTTADAALATDQQHIAAVLQDYHRALQQHMAELRKKDGEVLARLKEASATTAETAGAPVPALPKPAAGAPAQDGLTDMVNLASAYSDATAAVRMAETKLRATEELHQTGVGPAEALDIAKTEFANAQSKAEVMGMLVKTSLVQAQRELSRWDGLAKAGAASTQDLENAKGRVEMLEVILRSASH